MVTCDLLEAVNISAMELSEGKDELQHASVTAQCCIFYLGHYLLIQRRILKMAMHPPIGREALLTTAGSKWSGAKGCIST